MRLCTFLCIVAVLVISGCQGRTANRVVVNITNAENPRVEVRVGATRIQAESAWVDQLTDILRQNAAANQPQQSNVVLRAEDGINYEDDARVVVACYRAGITSLTFADITVQVPRYAPLELNPRTGKPYPPDRFFQRKKEAPRLQVQPRAKGVVVELLDAGPSGEYVDGGTNEYVCVMLGEKMIPLGRGDPKDVAVAMERQFEDLTRQLKIHRANGTAESVRVVILPSMSCRHHWVVKACKAAVAAGFADIELAWPDS
jgi:biopolymer transport protein ExbD